MLVPHTFFLPRCTRSRGCTVTLRPDHRPFRLITAATSFLTATGHTGPASSVHQLRTRSNNERVGSRPGQGAVKMPHPIGHSKPENLPGGRPPPAEGSHPLTSSMALKGSLGRVLCARTRSHPGAMTSPPCKEIAGLRGHCGGSAWICGIYHAGFPCS